MHPISPILVSWYAQHHRPLPWRQTSDPYCIWVSEVILQQTRVDQGLEYYMRFVERWPDVASLAKASEEEVLRMWQGLGYYSRARNLLAGARQVMDDFGGIIPADFDRLLTIKGIGLYTAAAIASIAFNRPVAVVDGNVARVLARLFAINVPVNTPSGQKMLHETANATLSSEQPGLHNQAMMELGALICLPRNPKCDLCCLMLHCQARSKGLQQNLPLKKPKPQPRLRWFNYLLIRIQNPDGKWHYMMHKRSNNDIWKGLYEPPLIESAYELDKNELIGRAQNFLDNLGSWQHTRTIRAKPHQLTHQRILSVFYEFVVQPRVDTNLTIGLSLVNKDQLNKLPLPRLIESVFEHYFNADN